MPRPPDIASSANASDNSESHRNTPAGIVADDSLSHQQKLRMLREWQNDLTGRNGASSGDVILLRLVMAAIADVERQARN